MSKKGQLLHKEHFVIFFKVRMAVPFFVASLLSFSNCLASDSLRLQVNDPINRFPNRLFLAGLHLHRKTQCIAKLQKPRDKLDRYLR
jgi:hypothetical protein